MGVKSPKRKRTPPRPPGTKKRRHRSGATQRQRLISAERENIAVAMRLDNKTLKEIAATLKISEPGVHKAIERAIARKIDLGVEQTRELRQKMLVEILAVIHKCWARSDDNQTIDRLVRLWDRQAKLCGLDAAIVLEHQGAGGGPIQIQDTRARMLGRLDQIAERLQPRSESPSQGPGEPESDVGHEPTLPR